MSSLVDVAVAFRTAGILPAPLLLLLLSPSPYAFVAAAFRPASFTPRTSLSLPYFPPARLAGILFQRCHPEPSRVPADGGEGLLLKCFLIGFRRQIEDSE